MNELEAKYLIAASKKPARVLRRVRQELAWAGYLAHPRGSVELLDTYYDSDDWRLRKAGWTYRIRQQDATLTATLKQLAGQRHNIFERTEFEQELPATPPGPEHLPEGPVQELLVVTLGADTQLRELFQQTTRRQRYHLTHPDHPYAFIELVLDQVAVASTPPMSYAEIEFELKEGPVNALQDLAGLIDSQPDLYPARMGKYQRGLLAAGHAAPASRVWGNTRGDVNGQWLDLALPCLNQQRLQLKQHEPFAWEALHLEGVHQLRVTSRRIRAGLQAFANVLPGKSRSRLDADVRWLTQALGQVRDLDVQLENLRSHQAGLARAQRPALNRYERHLQKRRRGAHATLMQALAGERFAALDTRFDELLEKATRRASRAGGITIHQAANDQVLPQLQSVIRKGARINSASAPRKLHRLRIDVKRLRYQLEILLDTYGKPARRAYKTLEKLQTVLGTYQDTTVALGQLQAYCDNTNLTRVERRTFKLLMRRERDSAGAARQKFPKRWSRFEQAARRLEQVL
jgi:inorganic triphosphatase YgiF